MSRVQHYVIYIPGLGDGADSFRVFALKTWRVYGMPAELVHMNWDSEKGYKPKYDRVVKALQQATKNGYTVSLVADSAGASLALNIFADHPGIHRVVTLCGVNSPKMKLANHIKARNPALDDSVKHLIRSLPNIDTSRVITLRAYKDFTVADKFTSIKGASNRRIWSIGHSTTISLCLTIYSWTVISAIRHAK